MCVATCEATTDRTPGSPSSIDMKKVVDPKQCTTIWTVSLAVVEEYRGDPQWFVERYRMHKRMPSRDVPFAAGAVYGLQR